MLLWHVSQGCMNSVTLHPIIHITEEMQCSEFNRAVSTSDVDTTVMKIYEFIKLGK